MQAKLDEEEKEKASADADAEIIQFSYMNEKAFEDNVKEIIDMTDEEAERNVAEANFVSVTKNTPQLILDNVPEAENLETIIKFDSLYLASRKGGIINGHYHNLGYEITSNLPNYISHPDVIVKLANGRLNLLTTMETEKGKNGLISIELNTVKDINNKNNKYNLIISAFSAKDNYIKNIISKNDIKILYTKEGLSQVNPQLYEWLATINEIPSIDSIPENSENVNTSGKKTLGSNSLRQNTDIEFSRKSQETKAQPDSYSKKASEKVMQDMLGKMLSFDDF